MSKILKYNKDVIDNNSNNNNFKLNSINEKEEEKKNYNQYLINYKKLIKINQMLKLKILNKKINIKLIN